MRAWGWPVDDKDCETHAALADALHALDAAGFVLPEGAMEVYKATHGAIAEFEIAAVPDGLGGGGGPLRRARHGAASSRCCLALRRMAQQEASARRFGSVAKIADDAAE